MTKFIKNIENLKILTLKKKLNSLPHNVRDQKEE